MFHDDLQPGDDPGAEEQEQGQGRIGGVGD